MKNLLIVESPAKAKTIGKYLGKDYAVLASFGHIRDLPSKTGSVEPDKDFLMHYAISGKSSKHVKEIVDQAKLASKIILAPDPDREGESIAWHVLEILKQKKAIKASTQVERVVFNAITKNSVLEAIKNPRDIDMDLVNAQQARRALDYLVGFTLSPVLWRKLPGSKSAGRVQSVALRLICDRENEIEDFKSQEFWTIKVNLKTQKSEEFAASIFEIEGKKLEKFSVRNEEDATKIKNVLEAKDYKVLQITKKQAKRRPYPPFTTSSLQQEAARKLGFSAKKTMMLAQRLYEGVEISGETQGLITYMRTDSVDVTPEAITQVRSYITETYGNKYASEGVNVFKSKVKNAQEAHEAIRPTDFSIPPEKVKKYLEEDQFSLYELVWKRMVASQMADVIFDQVIAEIITLPSYAKARALGTTINFDGFHKIYNEDEDDSESEDSQNLPNLKEGEDLNLIDVSPTQHFTQPPPRYSEASLVKKLEELGIGRPSTYASIISVIQERGYVKLDKRRFFPQERGRIVTSFLKEFFTKYVEYDYTANLEDDLDVISNGKMQWKKFLKKFWDDFHASTKEVSEKPFMEVLETLNKQMAPHILGVDENGNLKDACPVCANGKLGLKLSKFGAFMGCSNYPDCKHTMKIFDHSQDSSDDSDENKKPKFEPRSLGMDDLGREILVKIGPYGPYLEAADAITAEITEEPEEVQEEESEKKKKTKTKAGAKTKAKAKEKKSSTKKAKVKKPKRVSIPRSMDPNSIDLKAAKDLLSLPRELGLHPETGEKIIANIGPYGPYILHNKKFVSVKEDNILEIGLNRAIDLIATAATKVSGRKSFRKKK